MNFLKYIDFLNEAQIGVLNKNVDINSVNYGNSPLEYVELMQKTDDPIKNWFIQKGLVKKIKQEAPKNDSKITKNDLDVLMEIIKNITADELTFARHIDDENNVAQAWVDLLKENGYEETMSEFFRIYNQVDPILMFLKDEINRPRPYQLAKYFNYPLYPLIRTDAMTASYPSGHALLGFVMGEYYSRKFPKIAPKLKALGEKIANSREITGIHYPSDTAISREICRIIFENNLI